MRLCIIADFIIPLYFILNAIMRIIIISGAPGSGKGTQAKIMSEKFLYYHLSTGNMLRNEIAIGSDLGKLAQSHIDDGNFVPDYVACEMICKFFNENNHKKMSVVFDGFPRTHFQCVEFEAILSENNLKINSFININVDKKELVNRLIKRNNILNRPDDADMSIIEHRFKLYDELTVPVINYYKNKKFYTDIDGNADIKSVSAQIEKIIDNI
jgi:adenylate kinase